MQNRNCFEAVHRLLLDLRSVTDDVLFGGVPVILGGDFAQILPVIKGKDRPHIVRACLQSSFIWPRLKQLFLRTNMRVRNGQHDEDFINWLGRLSYDPSQHGQISLPSYISQPGSIEELIGHIYPPHVLQMARHDRELFKDRCILTTCNAVVADLNCEILKQFPGDTQEYFSINEADLEQDLIGNQLPTEFLQSIDAADLPPAKLELKVGAPVMLLRNMLPPEGLCNGTRLVVTTLRPHAIEAVILGGNFDGQKRIIPRFKLTSEEPGFRLTRTQYPLRLCFAMTINKSQGQSFNTVGVDLRAPPFSHGQFYVAVSRTSSVAGLHVLLTDQKKKVTTNVVFPEVLSYLNQN